MMIYNDFCKKKECNHFIEWDYSVEVDHTDQPIQCTSCQLVGQSHDIDEYPEDCPFIDEISKLDERK